MKYNSPIIIAEWLQCNVFFQGQWYHDALEVVLLSSVWAGVAWRQRGGLATPRRCTNFITHPYKYKCGESLKLWEMRCERLSETKGEIRDGIRYEIRVEVRGWCEVRGQIRGEVRGGVNLMVMWEVKLKVRWHKKWRMRWMVRYEVGCEVSLELRWELMRDETMREAERLDESWMKGAMIS